MYSGRVTPTNHWRWPLRPACPTRLRGASLRLVFASSGEPERQTMRNLPAPQSPPPQRAPPRPPPPPPPPAPGSFSRRRLALAILCSLGVTQVFKPTKVEIVYTESAPPQEASFDFGSSSSSSSSSSSVEPQSRAAPWQPGKASAGRVDGEWKLVQGLSLQAGGGTQLQVLLSAKYPNVLLLKAVSSDDRGLFVLETAKPVPVDYDGLEALFATFPNWWRLLRPVGPRDAAEQLGFRGRAEVLSLPRRQAG